MYDDAYGVDPKKLTEEILDSVKPSNYSKGDKISHNKININKDPIIEINFNSKGIFDYTLSLIKVENGWITIYSDKNEFISSKELIGIIKNHIKDNLRIISFNMGNLTPNYGFSDNKIRSNKTYSKSKHSTYTENEITSFDEFKSWLHNFMKNAHGENYNEQLTEKVANNLDSKYNGDYGAMIGAAKSFLY